MILFVNAEYELIYRESNQIGGCLGTRMCLQIAGKEELQRSMRTLLGMTSIPRLICDGSRSHNQNLGNVHFTCIQFIVHCVEEEGAVMNGISEKRVEKQS